MAEQEAAINPKPIISLMFGVSVGFWANTLAKFVEKPEVAGLQKIVILISGILFLLDLLCIVWWYPHDLYSRQAVYVDFTGATGVGDSHAYFEGKPLRNPAVRDFFGKAFHGQRAETDLEYDPATRLYRLTK